VEKLIHEMDGMEEKIKEKEREMGEREGRVGEREGRVGEREGRVGEREEEVEKRERGLAERRGEIALLVEQVSAREHAVKAREDELAALASASRTSPQNSSANADGGATSGGGTPLGCASGGAPNPAGVGIYIPDGGLQHAPAVVGTPTKSAGGMLGASGTPKSGTGALFMEGTPPGTPSSAVEASMLG